MPVTVKAEGLLPGEAVRRLALDDIAMVGDVARALPLARTAGLVILVNGKLAQWETNLCDGDVVELIPVLSGG